MPKKSKCACCQEDISEKELISKVDEIIHAHQAKEGALIPILQIIQGTFGYLPEAALKQVSTSLNKPFSEVSGVAGFYSFFSMTPRGKHLIRICMGTACYVRGGLQVLEALKKHLKVDVGGTTPDRVFTLETGRCFGACGLAPAMAIDDVVYKRVRPSQIPEILKTFRKTSAKGE